MASASTDAHRRIIDVLASCRRVLITTHIRPDGDALGSCAAAVLALRKAEIEAEVLLLSGLPRKYGFVFQDNGIVHHDVEQGWPDRFPFERFDALLVIDTGTWSQLPGLKERIAAWTAPKLVVDHHLTQEDWATHKLVVTEAAAAGEVVAELLDAAEIEIDRAIATALYVAIASDTGWFQFSNTRPSTLRLAARLMEASVDTDRLNQLLNQGERAERVALMTRAMQSMQLLAGNRLAVMSIRGPDFVETGADVSDTENLVNIPLQIADVQVAMLISEPKPPARGPIRVSLRSKGAVDVARFAEGFGGGGHARAAGLKVAGDFVAAKAKVVAAMLAVLGDAPTT
jgi:phosphoesterase RecJ-like protein